MIRHVDDFHLNSALLEKYNQSGPRYTSYPTALQFSESFDRIDYLQELLERSQKDQAPPLSLYVHLPFCESVCFYCGCNVTFTADHSRTERYLKALEAEMDMVVPWLGRNRKIGQMHWGGGTPTFFEPAQLERLFKAVQSRFRFEENAELGIEVDPRVTREEHVRALAACGFNRLSLGVQDFDPDVQKAINRIQPESMTRATVEQARGFGFGSISLDLIYGLPLQTPERFSRTLDRVLTLDPDRLSLFNFAYLPNTIRHQRAIFPEDLPSPGQKLEILQMTIDRLRGAGYRYIGMDHFAKPEDELSRAQERGELHRNYQGYTTHGDCDLIGFGVSAIGNPGRIYSQNVKDSRTYEAMVLSGVLPVGKGLKLSLDDLRRRDVIMKLMCNEVLYKREIEIRHGIRFDAYFKEALEQLKPIEEDGLLSLEQERIVIRPLGRLLVRNIAMAFDAYQQRHLGKDRFSRTI